MKFSGLGPRVHVIIQLPERNHTDIPSPAERNASSAHTTSATESTESSSQLGF